MLAPQGTCLIAQYVYHINTVVLLQYLSHLYCADDYVWVLRIVLSSTHCPLNPYLHIFITFHIEHWIFVFLLLSLSFFQAYLAFIKEREIHSSQHKLLDNMCGKIDR